MCFVTRHGKKRLAQRAGITKGVAEKQVEKIMEHGITHAKATGYLKDMMENKYHNNYCANNIKFYGNKLYVFHNATLITVLNVSPSIVEHLEENIEPKAYKKYMEFMNGTKKKKPQVKDEEIVSFSNDVARNVYRRGTFRAVDVILRTERKILLGYISDQAENDEQRFEAIGSALKENYGFKDVVLVHKVDKEGQFKIFPMKKRAVSRKHMRSHEEKCA